MSDARPSKNRRREPSAIQPHGWLIVCDAMATRILRHSANLDALFPDRAGSFIGAPLNELVGAEAAHSLRNSLSRFNGPARPALLPECRFAGHEGAFNLATSRAGDETLIEIERAESNCDCATLDRTRAMVDRIAQANDVEKLLATAARLIFSILQYDIVSILRLNGDGTAHVLAQQKRHDLVCDDSAPYPPGNALARNGGARLRVVADQNASPAPILSGRNAGLPDLTWAHLRAVTSDEREALRRGGFVASLSIALIVNGDLWGLVHCQHRAPQIPSMDLRAIAETFGDFLSLHLQVLLQKQALQELSPADPQAVIRL